MFYIIFAIGVGWMVSFLGQLPLGTMSITATQISVEENFSNAWKYSIGVALIEMIYLRLVLYGVDWIMTHQLFFTIFGWVAAILFLVLGIASFVIAVKQKKSKKAFLLNNQLDRFFLGISMSAFNPAQIPFWFVWSTFVLQRGWLHPTTIDYNLYTLGTGIGTVSGLAVYIYGGKWLIQKMNTNQQTLNKIIGVVFIMAALLQAYKLLTEPLF